MKKNTMHRGYTLIELIISVGLFAVVMTLAAGAYLIVISINRQTQGITSGIDNLSFALETMTRTIRTGTGYGCPIAGQDCITGGGTFVLTNSTGVPVSFYASGNAIYESTNGATGVALTDPSITITALTFYTTGVQSYSGTGDTKQARVTIVVSGTVASGTNKGQTVPFTIETAATMRGTDL